MTIIDNLLTMGAAHGRPGIKLVPKGILVHYVGNSGTSAKANRDYFENGSDGASASAHYIIGLDGEIIRCIPDNEVAWHAGRSYGPQWNAIAPKNNSTYIGIECCHPDADGKFSEKTIKSLVDLCVDLSHKYGFNLETDILRHYDVSGKNCPLNYVNNPGEWGKLKNRIVDAFNGNIKPEYPTKTPILAKPSATIGQMRNWARSRNATPLFIDLAQTFWDVAVSRGVDPVVPYCLSGKETGNMKFGGVLDASFNNPCGMKTTQGGDDKDPDAHQRFDSWAQGITAEVDHLAIYAGAPGYPKADSPDPRAKWVKAGSAPTVEELGGGNWNASPTYGLEVLELMRQVWVSPDELPVEQSLAAIPSITVPPKDISLPSMEIVTDTPNVDPSDWARDSWNLAKQNGITDGSRPKDAATREETVAMILRATALKMDHGSLYDDLENIRDLMNSFLTYVENEAQK